MKLPLPSIPLTDDPLVMLFWQQIVNWSQGKVDGFNLAPTLPGTGLEWSATADGQTTPRQLQVAKALELQFGFIFDLPNYYKTFSYDDAGKLTSIKVFRDGELTSEVARKTLSYNGDGTLASIVFLRQGDGAKFTKTLSYSNNRLSQITAVVS